LQVDIVKKLEEVSNEILLETGGDKSSFKVGANIVFTSTNEWKFEDDRWRTTTSHGVDFVVKDDEGSKPPENFRGVICKSNISEYEISDIKEDEKAQDDLVDSKIDAHNVPDEKILKILKKLIPTDPNNPIDIGGLGNSFFVELDLKIKPRQLAEEKGIPGGFKGLLLHYIPSIKFTSDGKNVWSGTSEIDEAIKKAKERKITMKEAIAEANKMRKKGEKVSWGELYRTLQKNPPFPKNPRIDWYIQSVGTESDQTPRESILYLTLKEGGFGLPKEPKLFIEIVEKVAEISNRSDFSNNWSQGTLLEIRDLTLRHFDSPDSKQTSIIRNLVWKLLICTKETLLGQFLEHRDRVLVENFEQYMWTEKYGKLRDAMGENILQEIRLELEGYFGYVNNYFERKGATGRDITSPEKIQNPWIHSDYWARAIKHIGMLDDDDLEAENTTFKDVKSGLKVIMFDENSAFRNKIWVTFWKCLELGSEEPIPKMNYDEWRGYLIEYLAEKSPGNNWEEIIPNEWTNIQSEHR
jgi:hypothetical protein